MADTLREAFADHGSRVAAASTSDAPAMLAAPQPAAIALVNSAHASAAPALPSGAAALDAGSGQWLVVSERDTPKALATHLANQSDAGTVTDVSHARCRIRVNGPDARDFLQSGITIDLGVSAFAAGRSTPTAFRDVPVLLHAADTETFDLYVLRSYAVSLRDWLADVCAR